MFPTSLYFLQKDDDGSRGYFALEYRPLKRRSFCWDWAHGPGLDLTQTCLCDMFHCSSFFLFKKNISPPPLSYFFQQQQQKPEIVAQFMRYSVSAAWTAQQNFFRVPSSCLMDSDLLWTWYYKGSTPLNPTRADLNCRYGQVEFMQMCSRRTQRATRKSQANTHTHDACLSGLDINREWTDGRRES